MTFQGERDFEHDKRQYQRVITYLLEIQIAYPDFFILLSQAPQFEFELEICRHRLRYARRYLALVKSQLTTYQHQENLRGKESMIHSVSYFQIR